MSGAGWVEIWKLALAQVSAQPIQIRILIGLGAAFVVLMIVEGLRVSFVTGHRSPEARRDVVTTPPEKTSVKKTAGAKAPSVAATSGLFRPRAVVFAHTPKRSKGRVNRHCAVRPKIRRMSGEFIATAQPAFTEDAAPYSPLPPIPEQIEL